MFVDLVRDGNSVVIDAEVSDEREFLSGKDLAGRVVGGIENDCPGLF